MIEGDALERAKHNLILYKVNKNISASNKRNFKADDSYIFKPLVLITEMDGSTFSPEHLVFVGHYDRPIYTVPRHTSAQIYSDSDEEGNALRNSGEVDPNRSTSSSVSNVLLNFPTRKKKKQEFAKKSSKYEVSKSKNDESVQRIAMLKLQSKAQVSIFQSTQLRTVMNFLI